MGTSKKLAARSGPPGGPLWTSTTWAPTSWLLREGALHGPDRQDPGGTTPWASPASLPPWASFAKPDQEDLFFPAAPAAGNFFAFRGNFSSKTAIMGVDSGDGKGVAGDFFSLLC